MPQKQEALRNAIVNSALPGSLGDAERLIFIRYVDELHEWHLKLLGLFANPDDWFVRHGIAAPDLSAGAPSETVLAASPELSGRTDFYNLLWHDLRNRRLVTLEQLETSMTGRSKTAPSPDRDRASLHRFHSGACPISGRDPSSYVGPPKS